MERVAALTAALGTWAETKEELVSKVVPPEAEEAPPGEPVEGEESPSPRNVRLPSQHYIDSSSADATETHAVLCAFLPELEPEEAFAPPEPDTPPPKDLQLVRRPRSRSARVQPRGFEVLTIPPPPAVAEEGGEEEVLANEGEGEGEGEEAALPQPTHDTRWVLPPHSTTQLQLQYAATVVGQVMQSLRFEMVAYGQERTAAVQCAASCAQPAISKDYRNVFHRKIKNRDPLKVKKAFVISRNSFEFGPLLVNRPSSGYYVITV